MPCLAAQREASICPGEAEDRSHTEHGLVGPNRARPKQVRHAPHFSQATRLSWPGFTRSRGRCPIFAPWPTISGRAACTVPRFPQGARPSIFLLPSPSPRPIDPNANGRRRGRCPRRRRARGQEVEAGGPAADGAGVRRDVLKDRPFRGARSWHAGSLGRLPEPLGNEWNVGPVAADRDLSVEVASLDNTQPDTGQAHPSPAVIALRAAAGWSSSADAPDADRPSRRFR